MKNYKEKITKLFESIDPENKLSDVKDQLTQAIEDDLNKQVQDQVVANQEQQKAEIEAKDQKIQEQEQVIEKQKTEIEELKQEKEQLEKACQEKEQQIVQQQEEIERVQKAAIQNFDQQIQDAKLEQEQEDDEKAKAEVERLVQAIDAKAEEEKAELNESISNFIDTFIDRKTTLQVNINAQALAEAQATVFGKIKDILFESGLYELGVKDKADKIIEEAKASANKEINEAIEANKAKVVLETKLEEANSQIAKLNGKILLTEKVKYIKPSVARKICEALEDKTIEEIEAEFDQVQADIEKEEEEKKQQIRQQKQGQGATPNKKLEQEDDEENKDDESDKEPINESVQGKFASMISTRIAKKH